jgi:hypothetical protein
MTNTVWEYDRVPAADLALGYRWEKDQWRPEPILHDGTFGAMGGLITRLDDFARYVAFHLDSWPPRDDSDNGPVRRATRREMHQMHSFIGATYETNSPLAALVARGSGYGYGLATSLDTHAARGALFETYVVSELMKQRLNAGQPRDLYFWRDSTGNEVDVILETAAGLKSIELKSGSTIASDWLSGLSKWKQLSQEPQQASQLVYGGDESYERNGVEVWSWRECWKAGAEP